MKFAVMKCAMMKYAVCNEICIRGGFTVVVQNEKDEHNFWTKSYKNGHCGLKTNSNSTAASILFSFFLFWGVSSSALFDPINDMNKTFYSAVH